LVQQLEQDKPRLDALEATERRHTQRYADLETASDKKFADMKITADAAQQETKSELARQVKEGVNLELQAKSGRTALQTAEWNGHIGIATLIRNKKHKGADRGKKDTILQASPEQIKRQLEDVHSFTPPTRLLRSHVLRDDMVGSPHHQSSIELLLFLLVLFLVLVLIIRRCFQSRPVPDVRLRMLADVG